MGAHVISQLLAPVVLISACGLISLALYNRLAAIVGRLRQFHHERIQQLAHLEKAGTSEQVVMQARITELQTQSDQVLRRARLVRNAVMALLACIASMLLCSLAIGLSMSFRVMDTAALVLFVLGLLLMLFGIGLALWELADALKQVEYEESDIDRFGHGTRILRKPETSEEESV
jgi:hypothetical protein